MFRYKKSVPVSYARQGYVYFKSLCFRELPEAEKRKIVSLCKDVAGDRKEALFQFVTTDAGAENICMRHHISRRTLERYAQEYYKRFPIC